jgi:hypothetical protein
MPPLLALGALLLAQAVSPAPVGVSPTPVPNQALGPAFTLVYRCTNGGTVRVGLTAHAAAVNYDGRSFVYARGLTADGTGILLYGSGSQWTMRGRLLTLTRGVGIHASVVERCFATEQQ